MASRRRSIDISPEAKQDIREAAQWIAKDNPAAATARKFLGQTFPDEES